MQSWSRAFTKVNSINPSKEIVLSAEISVSDLTN